MEFITIDQAQGELIKVIKSRDWLWFLIFKNGIVCLEAKEGMELELMEPAIADAFPSNMVYEHHRLNDDGTISISYMPRTEFKEIYKLLSEEEKQRAIDNCKSLQQFNRARTWDNVKSLLWTFPNMTARIEQEMKEKLL